MKAIQITILTIAIFTFNALASTAQSTVTLEDVLDQVRTNSFSIKTAKTEVAIAQEGNSFYKSLLKPSLTLQANLPNYNKTSTPIIQPDGTIAFQSIRQANSSLSLFASQAITQTGGTLFMNTDLQRFDDLSSEYTTYNGIPIRLGISQPLFGYNPWKYEKKIQPLLLQEAQKNFNTAVESALSEATELYFDVLIAHQNLEIAKTNERVNEDLLRITEERLLLGKVSKDEKLQLEIELSNAKLGVSQATNEVERTRATLNTFLGESKETEQVYTEPNQLSKTNIDYNQLLDSYQKNRPEITAYQRSLAESNQEIARTKANYGFQANINASIGLARGSETPSEIYSDPFDEQQFNLSIQVPILDWGKRKSAVAQAQLRQDNLSASYNQQILVLENNINQLGYAFERLQRDIGLFKNIMDKADERFTISNERYVLGNISITNLTLAQREKDQAKRNYINALKSYWVSYYQLRLFTGYDIISQSDITY